MIEYTMLVGAAVLAGALNVVAGGSFISLPALLFYGVPPTMANATSGASLLPGDAGSLIGCRHGCIAAGSS